MNDYELLTVKETARMIGVTEIHLRKLLNEGKISYINLAAGKIRQSIRIQKKEVDKFIKQGGVK